MKHKIKADAFGTDEQFAAYIKQSRRQQKLVLAAIIVIVIMAIVSCGDKDGCGDYGKWESHTKFRSK